MINLVVALPAEARPLINHYGLNDKQTHAAFALHRNKDMTLVVSGPGKASAAAATTSGTRESTGWVRLAPDVRSLSQAVATLRAGSSGVREPRAGPSCPPSCSAKAASSSKDLVRAMP